jgi:gluconokinase
LIVLVMGVSGAGKSAVGEALARSLGWRFIDADDFHPPANVAKMAAGIPLEDSDRWPWLQALNELLASSQARGESAVLACSALKESYRERLRAGVDRFQIVHLRGDFELIHGRLAQRRHRFMPASLLRSQFAALEPPADAIVVDVAADVAACVSAIAARLGK